jgi:DNA-binding LytR/AlgR family response regulator
MFFSFKTHSGRSRTLSCERPGLEQKQSLPSSTKRLAIARDAGAAPSPDFAPFARADAGESFAELLSCLSDLKRERASIEMFLVKQGERGFFVRGSDIDWIESSRNNVILHVGSLKHAYHATMLEIEAKLNPREFIRIHRSVIVNIEKINEMHAWFNGSWRVTLRDGTLLSMSKPYRQRLFRRMAV